VNEKVKPAEDGGEELAAPGRRPASQVASGLVEHFLGSIARADRSPRLIIDEDCNVLWQSPDSERLLQPPLPLFIKSGRLCAAPASGMHGWTAFIERLGEERERHLLTGKGGTWVLVTGWAERHDGRQVIFIRCAMSFPFRDVAASGLARAFGLTRSESAVLDEFARLRKPAQIAEQLGISVSTVRSHLKQIHVKMAVNSNVQLLRITRAYCDTA